MKTKTKTKTKNNLLKKVKITLLTFFLTFYKSQQNVPFKKETLSTNTME